MEKKKKKEQKKKLLYPKTNAEAQKDDAENKQAVWVKEKKSVVWCMYGNLLSPLSVHNPRNAIVQKREKKRKEKK